MNHIFIFSIMLLTLFLNSCNDKEFREELKFVNSILENPENIQQIIESSPFYDSTYFNLHGNTYNFMITNMTSEGKCKVKIDGFGKPQIPLYNKYNLKEFIMVNDSKVVVVKKECLPFIIYFIFRDYNEKSILVGLNIGYI